MANGVVDGGSTGARSSPRPRIRLSPIGFWSYSRRDDELSRGRLSQLRSLLLAELQTQYGRDGIQLFQDVSAIPHGADWERVTTGAIDQSTFFIPIITPFYMQSRWCARETRLFEAREETIFDTYPDLLRDRRRIFPLLWIDVSDIEPVDEEAFAAVKAAQWCDFSQLRHRKLEQDEEVLARVAAFARSIVDVLQLRVEAPLSEEEKTQLTREAEEAERLAEEQRKRQKAEEAEKERLRALEAQRIAAEEAARRAAQEEKDRLATEEREREAAARAEEARKLEAKRQEAEKQREAERRARRDAGLDTIWKSRWLAWALGGIIVIAVLFLVMRPSGSRPDQNVATAAESQASAAAADLDAAAANAMEVMNGAADPMAAQNAAAPAVNVGPAIGWLFGRWCVGGNRRNVQTISGDRDRILIAFNGGLQPEVVREIGEGVVRTEIARYRREGDALVIEEAGREQRLMRCG